MIHTVLPIGLGWFLVVGMGGSCVYSKMLSLLHLNAGIVDCYAVVSVIFVSIIKYLTTLKVDFAKSSEIFSSAGHSIGSGWIACHVVSQWTWAATLLQSSHVAYTFGVSGPFWSVS